MGRLRDLLEEIGLVRRQVDTTGARLEIVKSQTREELAKLDRQQKENERRVRGVANELRALRSRRNDPRRHD